MSTVGGGTQQAGAQAPAGGVGACHAERLLGAPGRRTHPDRDAAGHSEAARIDQGLLPVVLVGLPGAGKTTVARELASLLGVQVTDTDAEIRRRARLTIPQIFAAEGEDGFRARETRTLRHVLESPAAAQGVVALGGGSVLREANRVILAGRTVVYLRARPETAAAHVGDGAGRPLMHAALAGPDADSDAAEAAQAPGSAAEAAQEVPAGSPDPVLERMRNLYAQRAGLYEQVASLTVDTDARTPVEVAEAIVRQLRGMASPRRVTVGGAAGQGSGGGPYEVVIGSRLDAELTRMVLHAPGAGGGGVAIVHADALAPAARRYEAALTAAGRRVVRLEVPGGEGSKRAEVLERLWDGLGEAGISRDGLVIGVGGGATTDLAGFAAATWLRGVGVIQVPTSLLGMVDAAVGGKTGIDTAAGKNLVGAFHPPLGVVCDLDHLATLPSAELVAGMGEIVKCGFIADSVILDRVLADAGADSRWADAGADSGRAAAADCIGSADAAARLAPGGGLPAWLAWDSPVLAELAARAVEVKARVVGEDLTEAGVRAVLNYGHTYAHAIETVTGYRWRHGEAVATGCVFAAEVARLKGYLDADTVALHRQAFAAAGLPVSFPQGAGRFKEMLAVMGRDKKVRGGRIRMVLLDAVGSPRIGVEPDTQVLRAAHAAVTGGGAPGAGAEGSGVVA